VTNSTYKKGDITYDISKLPNPDQALLIFEALKNVLTKKNSYQKETFILTAAQETLQNQLESFLVDTAIIIEDEVG
tara:strand:+ start:362 stop:589 length:228 start_codon:yes stop_codon:yes gene_type:complete